MVQILFAMLMFLECDITLESKQNIECSCWCIMFVQIHMKEIESVLL